MELPRGNSAGLDDVGISDGVDRSILDMAGWVRPIQLSYFLPEPVRLRKRMIPNEAAAAISPQTAVGFSGESTHPPCACASAAVVKKSIATGTAAKIFFTLTVSSRDKLYTACT